MVSSVQGKIEKSALQLKQALDQLNSKTGDKELQFLTVAKAFEVLVEYAWRELKYRVENEGLSAPSPKEAVRKACRIELIAEPERWIDSINARNDSVHNYFGIPRKKYIDLADEFIGLVQPLIATKPKK